MKIHFSRPFKETLSLSREEAIRLQSDTIGTGHLLLAMIRRRDSNMLLLFSQATVPLPDLQREIEAGIIRENSGAGTPAGRAMIRKMRFFTAFSSPHPNGIPLSRKAEKAIRTSPVLAVQMESSTAEPEHLFLSMLKDEDNLVAGILSGYSLTYEIAEASLRHTL